VNDKNVKFLHQVSETEIVLVVFLRNWCGIFENSHSNYMCTQLSVFWTKTRTWAATLFRAHFTFTAWLLSLMKVGKDCVSKIPKLLLFTKETNGGESRFSFMWMTTVAVTCLVMRTEAAVTGNLLCLLCASLCHEILL
jgi:hypothetical protein